MSHHLEVLDIQHNDLSGTLPTTFCIGRNNLLNDRLPMWLGTLPELRVLSLRSNKLHGPIRTSGSEYMFLELRLLDLSSNAFMGNLPTSLFQHFRAIKKIDPSKKAPSDEIYGYYEKSIAFVTKGMEHEVLRILFLYTTIDFPNNKFEGHIPSIIGDLIALSILNLSHNGLQGPIPQSLGSLSSVESLDLSGNHLVGEIPAQFASLTFLEVSNLSYNHLEGCIPQGPQFHTFENNSYEIMINYMDFHFQKVVNRSRAGTHNYDGKEKEAGKAKELQKKK
ncbi:putative 3-oxoacyl-[acyl-carrier-protein] reductase 3, chloroplastic-like [Capsicum annuum]|nr:putative 3-oxoacyl-[acyl-carrier-protein] reductase 3, chloroplastic-like [Capsicum annuum]